MLQYNITFMGQHMRRWRVLGIATGAIAASASAVGAQGIVLPEVVVEAPSPIRQRGTLVVTPGTGSPPFVEGSFVPITVFERGDILRSPGRTIGEVIQDQPGITSTGYAPGASTRPVIRGLDNFRVRLQENGIGSQDVSDLGEDHGVPIDPLAAGRIEVIRGPAALRFGPTAIGGVVSVSNNRIPTVLPSLGASAEVTAAISSVDRGREGSAIVDAAAGNVALHADLFARRSENYDTPLGRQENSYARANGQAAGGSLFFDGGFIGASVSRFAAVYGVPGLESSTRRSQIDLEQTRFQSHGAFRPSGGLLDTVRFWFGASEYRHNENAVGEDELFGVRSTFRNREWEARVEAQTVAVETPLGLFTTAIGTQFGRQRLGTEAEANGLLAPATTESAAGYLFSELAVGGGLRFQAAGRVDHARVAGAATFFPTDFLPGLEEPTESPITRRFTPLSASFGILQELPFGVVASLTGQYVERAPRAAELFSRGAHDATGTFEIGDPNLRIETARSIEFGLRRAAGSFRFDATFFHTRYDGFIFRRLTGNLCDDEFASCGTGTELQQVVYDQRDATFRGAEIRVQQDLFELFGGSFGVEGRYDIVRATFSGGENVPRIPPHRLGGGLFWRDANWLARIDYLHAFAVTRIAPEETPTPGYDLLNAQIVYNSTERVAGRPRLTAGLIGTNLLDEVIRNHVSFRKDEVIAPGRGVRAFLTIRF
jgi:iron complex outermembrane receptor protein